VPSDFGELSRVAPSVVKNPVQNPACLSGGWASPFAHVDSGLARHSARPERMAGAATESQFHVAMFDKKRPRPRRGFLNRRKQRKRSFHFSALRYLRFLLFKFRLFKFRSNSGLPFRRFGITLCSC
jgi:hypothetical protein